MADLPGLDLDKFGTWLRARHDVQGELRGSLITGGRSNLTYRVDDDVRSWAVRRPPLGHVLPTAHDMVREFTVISALAPTDVPVAPPVALCTDAEVLGATFYVMDFVDGAIVDSAEKVDALDRTTAAALGDELVDTLARLHAIDPASVGLGEFGRPEGFIERQVRRWHQQWEASETRPLPIEAEVVATLRAKLPVSGPPTIVHGDYRLTNVIFDKSLVRIAAIVDWEMATLGDPLTDVGLLHVYHALAEQQEFTMPLMKPERGFRSATELDELYGAASGRDVSTLPWYVGFAYFKLAVISEGIAARFLQGKTVGPGFADFSDRAPGLLESAAEALASI